ncbi:thiamine diphosphokinase [Clostridium lundense]|uniref:thiamine diphosphokinase n=1 Tax=Clostridium lundense TaxID=319475 RepID=UPI00048A2219|nr:thiamine diphosphokinase [Clostridium lundense]
MKALVLSGGNPPPYDLIKEEIRKCNILISADSGANILYEYRIKPNVMLGDFDSIDEKILKYYENENVTIEKFPAEKDFTDSYGALEKAVELGAKEIGFLGCTGSRIDHMLGNIGLLLTCLELGVKCYIRDENNLIRLVDEPITIEKEGYTYFSLIGYGGGVKGITITGAKYPLKDYNLRLGESLGVSNEILEDSATIDFREGLLLVIQSKD